MERKSGGNTRSQPLTGNLRESQQKLHEKNFFFTKGLPAAGYRI